MACIHILDSIQFDPKCKMCSIVGDSLLVGSPLSLYLQNRKATVTVCNSHTTELKDMVKRADLIVTSIGVANIIKGDMIKKGAIVIDAGNNMVVSLNKRKVVGDVEFSTAMQSASYITPVPGGIGPLSVSMLMVNVMKSWKHMNHIMQ